MKYYFYIYILFQCLTLKAIAINYETDSTVHYGHSIYIEATGNKKSFSSINFEYNLLSFYLLEKRYHSSLSIRGGIGAVKLIHGGVISMFNWQIGKRNKIELGAGLLYVFVEPGISYYYTNLSNTKYNFFYTSSIGYKFVPKSIGPLIKVSYSPIISFEGNVENAMCLSIGWSW